MAWKTAGSVAATILASTIGLVGAAASAEETGEQEYLNYCAGCHGEAGAGPGTMSYFLTIGVPSLTGLSAANDGEFPMLEVIQIIDGRTGVRGHGEERMPIWGAAFKARDADAGAIASEIEARGRILSLALYLESIQE